MGRDTTTTPASDDVHPDPATARPTSRSAPTATSATVPAGGGTRTTAGTSASPSSPTTTGLLRLSGNRWAAHPSAPAPAQVGTPDGNDLGQTIGGTLEMSNVDLASEFTNMIIAQRGFQANSRVISTSDEMLQDLVNLKR